MLAFLGARAIPGVETVAHDGGEKGGEAVYRRTVRIEGFPGVLEIRRPTGARHLLLRAHLPRWEGLIHVVERARRLFDLDADEPGIRAALRHDPLLATLVRRRPGLRVPGAWDPLELAVRAVLGQQVSVRAATTLAGRLVEQFGTAVPGLTELGLTHLFPDAATLADTDLRPVGVTSARAATVAELARRALDGSLILDGSRDLERTIADLRAVPGIGPWTANYIAMRACGEPDALPASDLGLRRVLGNGRPLTTREVEERAALWRPWRSYGVMHLWTG